MVPQVPAFVHVSRVLRHAPGLLLRRLRGVAQPPHGRGGNARGRGVATLHRHVVEGGPPGAAAGAAMVPARVAGGGHPRGNRLQYDMGAGPGHPLRRVAQHQPPEGDDQLGPRRGLGGAADHHQRGLGRQFGLLDDRRPESAGGASSVPGHFRCPLSQDSRDCGRGMQQGRGPLCLLQQSGGHPPRLCDLHAGRGPGPFPQLHPCKPNRVRRPERFRDVPLRVAFAEHRLLRGAETVPSLLPTELPWISCCPAFWS
mmetsp:Transcript_44990/g.75647  ORF Transcript_44990/g.75647 Transcript_44990/m.75647 type:complete len:256 (+) Transcript_44990:1357-2124(+)